MEPEATSTIGWSALAKPGNGIGVTYPTDRRLRPLALRPAYKRQRTELDRHPDLIDRGLWEIFGTLANGRARWPLFLHGPAGVGKTRAALFLCDVAETAIYATADAATDNLLKKESLWWSQVAKVELTVLDELGMRGAGSDIAYVALKRFIDSREEKPAVYISNLAPKDVADFYDDRIASRVLCGTIYKLDGEDRRFV